MLNMVASIDGSVAVEGRSGALGGSGDKAVFSALRATADVILVAAGTARAESYGPPRPPSARRAERERRGQKPVPRIAVVSRSLDLDPASPLFSEVSERTIVFTVAEAPPDRRRALEQVAEVVEIGSASVDLTAAVGALRRSGCATLLVEGGPSLNGQMLDLDLLDEVNLTTSPNLVGGSGPRLAFGESEVVRRFSLAHLWEDDDFLFARYLRRR